jgi:hypothetical protein
MGNLLLYIKRLNIDRYFGNGDGSELDGGGVGEVNCLRLFSIDLEHNGVFCNVYRDSLNLNAGRSGSRKGSICALDICNHGFQNIVSLNYSGHCDTWNKSGIKARMRLRS